MHYVYWFPQIADPERGLSTGHHNGMQETMEGERGCDKESAGQ